MPRRPSLHQLVADVPAELAEELGAYLVGAGAGGVEEQESEEGARLVVYGEDRAAISGLARALRAQLLRLGLKPSLAVRAAPAGRTGWETEWMRHLEPVRVSRTLVLVPTSGAPLGEAPRVGRGGHVVRLEPAMAFGFGEHPTTRLAARSVERACGTVDGLRVLDVGTGSGVLAIVAAVSGAVRVVGVDVDERAVMAARRNAQLNDVARRCRFSVAPVTRLRAPFGLVVGNLDRRTLLALAPALAGRVQRGGTLLLTGILSADVRDLLARYTPLGLERVRVQREQGWALVALRRREAR